MTLLPLLLAGFGGMSPVPGATLHLGGVRLRIRGVVDDQGKTPRFTDGRRGDQDTEQQIYQRLGHLFSTPGGTVEEMVEVREVPGQIAGENEARDRDRTGKAHEAPEGGGEVTVGLRREEVAE